MMTFNPLLGVSLFSCTLYIYNAVNRLDWKVSLFSSHFRPSLLYLCRERERERAMEEGKKREFLLSTGVVGHWPSIRVWTTPAAIESLKGWKKGECCGPFLVVAHDVGALFVGKRSMLNRKRGRLSIFHHKRAQKLYSTAVVVAISNSGGKAISI